MKKLLSLVLALCLVFSIMALPVGAVKKEDAVAAVKALSLIPKIQPGETRRETEFSYAWLDRIIIRDDPTSFAPTTLVPKPSDYPYSHTFSEFVDEVEIYKGLKNLDENTVASGYEDLMTLVYYSVIAMGLTDEYDVMEKYLRDYGISVPDSPTNSDKVNVTVTYAALKYDAVYLIYGKKVSIPKGTTAEGAAVIVLSALSGMILPSGITSYTGLASYSVKKVITEVEDLPVSKNPKPEETFYWAKIITAGVNGYDVPNYAYDIITKEEKTYVDSAYFATILESAYGVKIDPEALRDAVNSSDSMAVQRVILKTMMYEKDQPYSDSDSNEALFEKACALGYFNLDEDFYSDVFNYDIAVNPECEKIWLTPFSIADQLEGGSVEGVNISIGSVDCGHNQTVSVPLNKDKAEEKITLVVSYAYGGINEKATYTFNIKKTGKVVNDVVAQIEESAKGLMPEGNENLAALSDSIKSNLSGSSFSVPSYQSASQSTYPDSVYENGTTNDNGTNYLDKLLDGKYPTDENGNIITSKGGLFAGVKEESENKTVIQRAAQTVKENPEIVAAPASIVALGAFAGYLFTKKRKDMNDSLDIIEESEELHADDE